MNYRANLLLLMTTGMSLKKWNDSGQLSRELSIYQKLGEELGMVYIYSYGKNEGKYVKAFPHVQVLSKFKFIPDYSFLPKRFTNYLYNFFSILLRWKLFNKIDFIKTNQFKGAYWGLILKKIFKIKLIVRMGFYYKHFQGLNEKEFTEEKNIFTNSNHIIITEEKAVSFLKEKYKIKSEQISCIHNYIDTDMFKPIDSKKEIDLLYVGRLHQRKNPIAILSAAVGLDLKVVFIGQGQEKKELETFALKHNIDLTIIKHVNNSELPSFYNNSKIFVLPSFYEGNPKVMLEAMSCSCAVIGSDVDGINNIIKDEWNGLLTETNADFLRTVIIKAINDQHLREKIGKNARDFIIQNYALEKLIHQEFEIYSKLNPAINI